MHRNVILIFTCSALFFFLLPGSSVGADFQSMTTEELSKLRGTMYNTAQEERGAFRAEWMKRIDQMTPEEKEQYLGSGSGRGQGNRGTTGLGNGQSRGKGGGSGGVNSAGTGQGGNSN